MIGQLRAAVLKELADQGIAENDVSWRPVLHIRYDGTDTTLPVNLEGNSRSKRPGAISRLRTRRSSASSTTTSR